MRFITSIDDGPLSHRLDAEYRFNEVRPLRELEPSERVAAALLRSHLPSSGVKLPGDKKWNQPFRPRLKGQAARDEIIVVSAVTVSAVIGVILKHLHTSGSEVVVPQPGTLGDDALSRKIVCHQLKHTATFRRTVLGVRMIIVETSAVFQHPITFHFPVSVRTLTILDTKCIFLFVLREGRHVEPTHVKMRTFSGIRPVAKLAFQAATADELHRFFNDVIVHIVPDNAVFRFQSQQRNNCAHIIDRLRVSAAA